MSKHTIEDLRATLFETLQSLRDPKNPMEIDRANAIKDIAQVIVNSAKVEVDHMRVTNGPGSGFIPVQSAGRSQLPPVGQSITTPTKGGSKTVTQLPNGATVTRHKMGG